MRFTDRYLKNLKPGAKRRIVWEENAHGRGSLGVRISPVGKKSWIYMYLYEGKSRMLTLGRYPQMTVAEAHAAFGNSMQLLERGIDPGARQVAANEMSRQAPSMEALAERFLEEWSRKRKRSHAEDARVLRRDVLPALGGRKAAAVTRADVRRLLAAIVDRGSPIQANRTLALVRKVFNWALENDLVENNPCLGIRAPAPERQRDRMLSAEELRQFLDRLPTSGMRELSQLALRLQLLTAQRCGEVMNMAWDEVDLSSRVWTIPGHKAKNGRSHAVPLSQQSLAVLLLAREASPGTHPVFASRQTGRSMVPTALARAVRRNEEHFGLLRFTPHDLRRTAASHMTSMGISRLVVSKILNHVESGVTAVYDRHSYDNEKREALESWGERVSSLEPSDA